MDSDLTGDLGNSNIILPTIIYSGVPAGYDCIVLSDLVRSSGSAIFVLKDDKRIATTIAGMEFFSPDINVIEFPAWDCLPFDRSSPKNDIISKRVAALMELSKPQQKSKSLILTSISAFLQRVPSVKYYANRELLLTKGEHVSRDKLERYLGHNGYRRVATVFEPGDFCIRGNIVDIFPSGSELPARADFFGDEIENIRQFSPSNQRSLEFVESLVLYPTREFNLDEESISKFRSKYRELFGAPKEEDLLYSSISNGQTHIGMEHWMPLFHQQLATVLDYLRDSPIVFDYEIEATLKERWDLITDCYDARLESLKTKNSLLDGVYNPLPPNHLYINPTELKEWIDGREKIQLMPFSTSDLNDKHLDKGGRPGRVFSKNRLSSSNKVFKSVGEYALDENLPAKKTVIACHSSTSCDRLLKMFNDSSLPAKKIQGDWAKIKENKEVLLFLVNLPLENGFSSDELNLITEQDILGDRLYSGVRKKRRAKDFIKEASTLTPGDLIVHSEHGIGRFEELKTINVAGIKHDCLSLAYGGGDRLFLPVVNIEVLSKYGDDGNLARLDRLGSASWQDKKAKLKKRIREIADQLISVAAARELEPGQKFYPQKEIYENFCARFPYEETKDQSFAVDDVISDLSLGKPMDRLICGDVGFGKTEIALRAAFIVAMEGRQVAIVVPTTLLARQHFNLFDKRFSEFPIVVRELSRMIPQRVAQKTKEEMRDGSADIIVGTHALLSKDISFHRLGLLIIDEEQRFGVSNKEKLKGLKNNVHVLTLTATPIPRTLQLALAGVRDLSIISTPPVDRLSVRTFISPKDPVVIREAIRRELNRGGQTFYVCPRIKDIKRLVNELTSLIPEIKIGVAHGAISPESLEEVMTKFSNGLFDILVATNIVESGLDLPNVNTLIVDQANRFGLAQLYQLRGRVGRSKIRGYAYFTLASNNNLTKSAQRRLEVMQSLEGLGAGFSLASHDLDIRGAGNLLGDEQSGHIKEVGVELYQQMLEDAVLDAKNVDGSERLKTASWSPQIDLGIPVLIPSDYVTDLVVRLSLYRRIGALSSQLEIDEFSEEMIDRFGEIPQEVLNLLDMVDMKQGCIVSGIDRIEAGKKGATISFRNNNFSNPAELIRYIASNKDTMKLRPDHKIVIKAEWQCHKDRRDRIKDLINEIKQISIISDFS